MKRVSLNLVGAVALSFAVTDVAGAQVPNVPMGPTLGTSGDSSRISNSNRENNAEYNRLIDTDPKARRMSWRRMVRDAQVYARGDVRHRDHKTIHLDGWHHVYMNRERFAKHARQIAFLD